MKTYEKYKKTNQIWLNLLPEHWESRKIKYLFSERSEKGFQNEQLLVSSQSMGVVPKTVYGNRTVEAQKDLHLLKLVKKGDFVISLRSFQGGIEYAYYQGIISPAYTIMINNGDIEPAYFRYLAKSQRFIELLQMCVTGIREGQNIDYRKLKNYSIPVPPRTEQDQIVRFLDWKVSCINKLIATKKKQIVFLGDLKKAVITQAVTKGIRKTPSVSLSAASSATRSHPVARLHAAIPGGSPTAKLGEHPIVSSTKIFPQEVGESGFGKAKDDRGLIYKQLKYSGIQWIGDIPSHWKVQKVKHFMIIEHGSDPVKEGNIPVYGSGSSTFKTCGEYKVGPAVLLGRKGSINNPQFIEGLYWNVDTAFNAYPCNDLFDIKYFYYLSTCFDYDYYTTQTAIPSMRQTDYKNIFIPYPPIEEQKEIVSYLDKNCKKIDLETQKIESIIETLKALKTRLISDVVTGKIDVRDKEIPEYEFVAEEQTESSTDTE